VLEEYNSLPAYNTNHKQGATKLLNNYFLMVTFANRKKKIQFEISNIGPRFDLIQFKMNKKTLRTALVGIYMQ